MAGVRGESRHPGEFRNDQNWIASDPPDAPIEDARYVPPPPKPEMEEALRDLETFLHEEVTAPALLAALAHYQFEAIHPFGDGNGCIGRLLISILPPPADELAAASYLSAYFERSGSKYYVSLLRVTTHGDWHGWLVYFLKGVASTVQGRG